ncbi:MAG TPA: adenylyl-sulfate kinase [Elusimicrobiota bacterium]|nr:adenylyl-sulfate kinase [Elusimicrobiota bacterium]
MTGIGFTVWFTGLPSSGKSTLAEALCERLSSLGHQARVFDGDRLRATISKDLGFTKEDRDKHVLRVGDLCRQFNREGGVALAALVSPYAEIRAKNREKIDRFAEVFVDAPLEVCIRRDVRGLYKKALNNEVKNFTGISDPYEPPPSPEIRLRTDQESVEESVRKILNYLEGRGWVETRPS